MNRLLCALLALPCTLLAQGFEISDTLPQKGRVSMAVYDSEGRMVRALQNAQPQTTGKPSVKWDGLLMDGQTAPAGECHWKLPFSQGMKADKKYPIEVEWSGESKGEMHLVWESASQQVTHLPTASLYPTSQK